MTDNGKISPFAGVRVINLGGAWAGRLSSMLMADQGADVIDIKRPGRADHPADPLLDRGKRILELDLQTDDGKARVLELAGTADIAIDNMRPGTAARLGVGFDQLKAANDKIVYIALPGFAEGDANRDIHAWEGVVDAAVGVFTDISPLGPLLGGRPIYSAIPMASAYGGVHGALAAALGLYHRLQSGRGQRIEVPLADAVMSAMALLVAKFEGQPARYNLPSIDNAMMNVAFPVFRDLADHMTDRHYDMIQDYLSGYRLPTFNHYQCADGRRIFLNAMDHVHQSRAALEVLGLFDQLVAEGLVIGNPYAESHDGNNLNNGRSLSPEWQKRLIDAISERFLTRPARDWEMALRDANVPCTVVQTTQEWLNRQPLKAGGVVTALSDTDYGQITQAGRFISIEGDGLESPDLSPRVAVNGATDWKAPVATGTAGNGATPSAGMLDGIRVLDLSNVIAGPAAGRTLAEFGADVIRIDAPAPQAGPRLTNWFGIDVNQGKQAIILDLKKESGRAVFHKLVADADVVLHNFLDASAESLGISHAQLSAVKPDIISCQISAWGGPDGGPLKDDPAFDPVLQAATGIMARFGGGVETPMLHAIASCVDYITGFSAALGIVQALSARAMGRGGSYVRTALAMGAQLVQFPFMLDHKGMDHGAEPSGQQAAGDGPHQHLYRATDGWLFLGCREAQLDSVAAALGAGATTAEALGAAIANLEFGAVADKLADQSGVGVIRVTSLEQVRDALTVDAADTAQVPVDGHSLQLVRSPHPSGYPTTLPVPSWHRPDDTVVRRLHPAPWPGEHTVAVLRAAGWSEQEVEQMLADGIAATSWPVLPAYLPV